jgi:hypothetical protein
MMSEVLAFVKSSSGLIGISDQNGKVLIKQKIDSKSFTLQLNMLSEVLQRSDADGKAFLQINFANGEKVLFTDSLVGFKPKETSGLDMTKIPRVVTTPDLISVYEAIEESLSAEVQPEQEIEVLKRVFFAILNGAESIGFDLSNEKTWIGRVASAPTKASA